MHNNQTNTQTRRISADELSRFFKGLASEIKAVGNNVSCTVGADFLNIFVAGGSISITINEPADEKGGAL